MKAIFKSTSLPCMVKGHRRRSARNATVCFRRKVIWKRISKTFTVSALQTLSVILVRSRFQTPAVLEDTWRLPYIPELTNCQKQNARDLQRRIVLLLTSGEFLRFRRFRVVLENSESVAMILPILAGRKTTCFYLCSDSSTASTSTTRSGINDQATSSNRYVQLS